MKVIYFRDLSPTWEILATVIPPAVVDNKLGFLIADEQQVRRLNNFILDIRSRYTFPYFDEVISDLLFLINIPTPFFMTTENEEGVLRLRKASISNRTGAVISQNVIDGKPYVLIEFADRADRWAKGFLADNGFASGVDIITMLIEKNMVNLENVFIDHRTVFRSYANTAIIHQIRTSMIGDGDKLEGTNIIESEVFKRVRLLPAQKEITGVDSEMLWKSFDVPIATSQQGRAGLEHKGWETK